MRNYMVPGQNYPQTLNHDKCPKMTYMYIMHFMQCYRFEKISKLCQYTDNMCGKFHRQYHRLTRTGTYRNCRRNLAYT